MIPARSGETAELIGIIVSGAGEGAGFVAIDWFRDAVRTTAGFDPYPGTLNVRLTDASAVARWHAIRARFGVRIDPPRREGCGGRLIAVAVEGSLPAAIIVPDVTRYGDDLLEVIAGVHLRTSLGRGDGDRLRLTVGPLARDGG